ncbi:bifunctional 3-deoxy-7-phosphoheptulonate synthase/chorismate mutase [Candidatus Uabimicrobium sp. HlEnr_7]|uniref:bifunctional 3-deoxy-7-phosphoheptulonate synthase/chorismate mutase n=1 Tax=Candidatus Uabimicrobium helgolandensis TaxID=3095367 RepID=UPI00355899DA
MIVQLQENILANDLQTICEHIQSIDYQTSRVKTQRGDYIVAIGKKEFDIRKIGGLNGVKDIHRVSDTYKLVSKKWKVDSTYIDLGDGVTIGNELTIIAGPCSIEGEEQVRKTIDHLRQHNVRIMRGGVFKPRTSPYSFQGMGLDGLKMWSQIARENNIKIISEILAVDQIEKMHEYVDIFQVGARNSQNFTLLHELGKVDKPVMLKRGISGTLDELLHSAEYIFSNGNERLILCERGIRTFEKAYRNTLDLNAVPILKEKSHLPVIVDPSHGIGVRRFVKDMALAGLAAGANGVIIEIHEQPQKAISDAQQTIDFRNSTVLIEQLHKMHALLKSF